MNEKTVVSHLDYKNIRPSFDSYKNLGSVILKDDVRYYVLSYKNMMNEKISLSSFSSSKSIYKIHKEIKDRVLNMYYEDTNFCIKVQFLSDLKRLIKDEHEVYKAKFLNHTEFQLEKIFNELYSKYIGIKSEDDLDSLLSKWKCLEDDYLINTKDFDSNIKYLILHKNKSLRMGDNLRKLIKNLETRENLAEVKESLQRDYDRNLLELKKKLEAMTKTYSEMSEKFQKMDLQMKDKNSELDGYREIIEKQREEIDSLRREEKRIYSNNMRASQMFYINTSKDRVPKCSDECVIY